MMNVLQQSRALLTRTFVRQQTLLTAVRKFTVAKPVTTSTPMARTTSFLSATPTALVQQQQQKQLLPLTSFSPFLFASLQLSSPINLIQCRFATKRSGGSTCNGRDSAGRRLGIKVWPNQIAKAGSIIIRQRGRKFRPGLNAGIGRDHTIFAKAAGFVKFQRIELNPKKLGNKYKKRHEVSVIPLTEREEQQAIAAATVASSSPNRYTISPNVLQ